jgi:hypothetical protein
MSELNETTGYANSVDTYWQLGWRGVIPLEAGTKWPPPTGFTGYGGIDPSYPDVSEWKEEPKYHNGNLGIRLPDDLVGIDVDCYDGKPGAATLVDAENRWGPLPTTYASTSRQDGSGIRLYRIPSGVQLHDRIEFGEGTGGIEVVQHHHRYVVAWPSFHPETGEQYQWHNGNVMESPPAPDNIPELPAAWVDGLRVERTNGYTAEIPADVMEFLTEGDMSPRVAKRLKEAVEDLETSRHDTTRDHVLALLRFGKCGDPGTLIALKTLREVFVANVAPDRKGGKKEATLEFNRFITNARAARLLAEPNKTEYRKSEQAMPEQKSAAKGKAFRMTKASTITDGVPEWAWEYNNVGSLQRRTLSLFAGRPGAGKSTAARFFAAGYSNGTLAGCFEGKPQNVAYVAAEESIEYMVKPSLRAVGANMDRIFFPHAEVDGNRVPIVSSTDEDLLTEAFLAEGVSIVIIDPVMSTIGAHADLNKSNQMRPYIEPWARIAERIGGLSIGVVHLVKAPGGDIVAAINGSSAFGEVARGVIAFAKDPESEEGCRIMSQVKNSAGPETINLTYTLTGVDVQTDGGIANMARFILGDPTDRTVADLMTTEKRQTNLGSRTWEVIEAVRNADGPVRQVDIANAVGIPSDDAGKYLRRLAEANMLTKVGRGAYIYRMV